MTASGGRAARLATAIQAEVADIVRRDVKDPRVQEAGILTVTHVIVSPDLRSARVLVSFLDSTEERAEAAIAGLQRAVGYVRGEVARRLSLRRAPDLRFVHDRTGEQLERIDALLRDDRGGGDGGGGS